MCRRRSWPPSPTTARCCWSATSGDAGAPRALPVVEAVPVGRDEQPFYDFEARYEIGRTRFDCPAELDEETSGRAAELALAVYSLLGCSGFARVDLMLDAQDGELYVLEADTVPGLTETSLLPQAAAAAGIDFDGLVDRVLAAAMATR